MKIAISGKGGVGKTTLAALLAQVYADAGRQAVFHRASRFRSGGIHHSPQAHEGQTTFNVFGGRIWSMVEPAATHRENPQRP